MDTAEDHTDMQPQAQPVVPAQEDDGVIRGTTTMTMDGEAQQEEQTEQAEQAAAEQSSQPVGGQIAAASSEPPADTASVEAEAEEPEAEAAEGPEPADNASDADDDGGSSSSDSLSIQMFDVESSSPPPAGQSQQAAQAQEQEQEEADVGQSSMEAEAGSNRADETNEEVDAQEEVDTSMEEVQGMDEEEQQQPPATGRSKAEGQVEANGAVEAAQGQGQVEGVVQARPSQDQPQAQAQPSTVIAETFQQSLTQDQLFLQQQSSFPQSLPPQAQPQAPAPAQPRHPAQPQAQAQAQPARVSELTNSATSNNSSFFGGGSSGSGLGLGLGSIPSNIGVGVGGLGYPTNNLSAASLQGYGTATDNIANSNTANNVVEIALNDIPTASSAPGTNDGANANNFHDSLGSLGMSTLDLEQRLGGPPTPELPGTASLSQMPPQLLALAGPGSDEVAGMGGRMSNQGIGQGTAKRQRIEFNPSAATMLTSLPNIAEFDVTDGGGDSAMMTQSMPNLSTSSGAAAAAGASSASSTTSSNGKKSSKKGGRRGSASAPSTSSTSTARRGPPPPSQLIRTPNASDVLFGRGGGTNVHIGNKIFRDLINAHRRSYLKARKNDKPRITQQILREIQEEHGGRFLKKAPGGAVGGGRKKKGGKDSPDGDVHDSIVGVGWYEVDDITAKEKISQALRQRAPELKKLIFKDEFSAEEIDYGQGNVVPVIFHPNPAENAYLRSLSVGLFTGGTEQVGQSHHAIEEAKKKQRRRMKKESGSVQGLKNEEEEQQQMIPMPEPDGAVPSQEQQQMLAQMQQVQMQLDQTAFVGRQQGLVAGDIFTAPLNDSQTFGAPPRQEQHYRHLHTGRMSSTGDSTDNTPTPLDAPAAVPVPAPSMMAASPAPVMAFPSLDISQTGLGFDASLGAMAMPAPAPVNPFEDTPYMGIDLERLSREQERKIKLIEIEKLRLQKQQLELQIEQQKQLNKALAAAPMPSVMDAFAAPGVLPSTVGADSHIAGGDMMMTMGDPVGMTDAQLPQFAQQESEGATPPSSLLSAMAGSKTAAGAVAGKLPGSVGDGSPIALSPADGTGGGTPTFNPFGNMQA